MTLLLNGAPVPVELDDAALAAIAAALEAGRPAEGPSSPWLTVKAAADYLGLTEHAIRKLLDRRQIPRHQPTRGGRILLRRADLDAYLDDLTHDGRRPR